MTRSIVDIIVLEQTIDLVSSTIQDAVTIPGLDILRSSKLFGEEVPISVACWCMFGEGSWSWDWGAEFKGSPFQTSLSNPSFPFSQRHHF